jgi:hypothetical protein
MSNRTSAAIIPAVVAFALTSLVSSTTFGAQELRNPLTPSYFSVKTGADSAGAASTQYLDRHNPLHPTHFAPERWIETGAPKSTPSYFVPSNPLHPGFKRS